MYRAMRLSIESLRAFREVVRTGNVTVAARELHLTQSAVSWKLRRLEEHVGRRLLSRDGRGLEATADGRALLAHAERVLDAHDAAVAHFSAPPLRGRLAFGATESVSAEGLTPLLDRLTRTHPGLEISVRIDQSRLLEEALDNGELDLAALKVPREDRRPDDRVLWQDELIWVGSDKRSIELEDPIPYISFGPGCFYHPIASEALARAGRTFRVVLQSAAISSVRDAVEAGFGIAILDRYSLGDGTAELVRLNEIAPLPSVYYIVRAGRSKSGELISAVGNEVLAGLAAGQSAAS